MASGQLARSLLCVVEGPDCGRITYLGETPVRIGRGKNDDFQVQDNCVTRSHLLIEWDKFSRCHILLQTGDSSTAINGIPIARNEPYRHVLSEGDCIQVGQTVMLYLREFVREGTASVSTLEASPPPASGGMKARASLNRISVSLQKLEQEIPPALTTLRYASLLSPKHVVLSWLRTLAANQHPELQYGNDSWEAIVRRLAADQFLHFDPNLLHSKVWKIDEPVRQIVLDTWDESSAFSCNQKLREFCAERLGAIRMKKESVRNQILTGDPNIAPTVWTTPSMEDVQSRVQGLDSVVDFGDGSYRLHIRPEWEEECLTAVVAQEFEATDTSRIEWALQMAVLPFSILYDAKERVGNAHLRTPESMDTARVSALYWLNLAHKHYCEGYSCRGSYGMAEEAVAILRRVCQQHPTQPEIHELLSQAERAHWAYDD